MKKIIESIDTEYKINGDTGHVIIDNEKRNGELLVWICTAEGKPIELTVKEAELIAHSIIDAISKMK